MRYQKMLGTGVMVVILMVAGNLAAQSVLYDGAIGDADPTSQGWSLATLGSATMTPDPVNDLVNIVVGSGDIDTGKYSMPQNSTLIRYAVQDDFYAMEFEAAFNDIGHDFAELDLITGLTSGSAGYRDRFFFYDYRVRFIGFTPTGTWGADARPAVGTGWTDMSDKNTYRWERDGTDVSFYANDELFWEGTGGANTIGNTQLEVRDNSTNAISMDWYSLSIENQAGEPPTSYVIYDGTVDNADPTNQNITLSGTQTVTVNDADDNIRIESSGAMWADLGDTNIPELAVITFDDSYYWEATLAVNDAVDQICDARLYTGNETGSAGYTDKVDFEDTRVRLFYLTADLDSPDADGIIERDMSVKTTYRYERQGDAVEFFIDDVLAFSGTGGSDTNGALQWYMYDWVGDMDIELYDYRFGEISELSLLVGDANRDGVVSAGDYASVQANFGNVGAAGIPGDANGDGVVSAGDYASVQANFGNTSPTQVTPEPATIFVITCGAIGLLRKRK